jgi:hypothetical protein
LRGNGELASGPNQAARGREVTQRVARPAIFHPRRQRRYHLKGYRYASSRCSHHWRTDRHRPRHRVGIRARRRPHRRLPESYAAAAHARAGTSRIERRERTKKAAVTKALQEFIARRKQKRLLELMGKLEWDQSYDYKSERSRS